MKHGKRKNQRAALTLRWEATMVRKSVNLLEFIFSQLSNLLPQEEFKFENETNLKIVIFLDVTFNLENSTYRSFRKPND